MAHLGRKQVSPIDRLTEPKRGILITPKSLQSYQSKLIKLLLGNYHRLDFICITTNRNLLSVYEEISIG